MEGVFRVFCDLNEDTKVDDLLKKSALAYAALMPYRYIFTLGLKGRTYTVRVGFPEKSYHHLAGLHKAGLASLRHGNASLRKVLGGQVTQRQIEKGISTEALADRWEGICRLRFMLERNEIVFQYRGHRHPGSIIQAEYLISDEQTLFFINGENPASIFGQRHQGYETGCPRMKVLRIEREEIASGTIVEIYRNPNYRQENPQ